MEKNSRLFLDFDGVLCDSIGETYVSSWVAFHRLRGTLPASVPLKDKERYYSVRPYIRDAEDYLILHYAVEMGIELSRQDDFDRLSESLGKKVLDEYRRAFFRARERLIDEWPEYWISLNPFYPFMQPYLDGFSRNDRVHILSSKKEEIISFILRSQNLSWPEERIHYAPGKMKIEYLSRFLDKETVTASGQKEGGPHFAAEAHFVEDQIDNVHHNGDGRIRPYLAGWGYLRDEWRTQKEIPVLDERGFIRLIENIMEKGTP